VCVHPWLEVEEQQQGLRLHPRLRPRLRLCPRLRLRLLPRLRLRPRLRLQLARVHLAPVMRAVSTRHHQIINVLQTSKIQSISSILKRSANRSADPSFFVVSSTSTYHYLESHQTKTMKFSSVLATLFLASASAFTTTAFVPQSTRISNVASPSALSMR
jgi:hypothetical protein